MSGGVCAYAPQRAARSRSAEHSLGSTAHTAHDCELAACAGSGAEAKRRSKQGAGCSVHVRQAQLGRAHLGCQRQHCPAWVLHRQQRSLRTCGGRWKRGALKGSGHSRAAALLAEGRRTLRSAMPPEAAAHAQKTAD